MRAQAADSQVLQCKAQLEQAQLDLRNTIIRSPATGVVGKRRIEAGQNVSVGQELIDVVSLDDVWITANFKQTQLVHLRPGQPVEIKVSAYGRTWKGHVTNLGGGASSVFSAMPLKGVNREPREGHAASTRSHRFRPFRKPELQRRRSTEAWVVGGTKSASAMAAADWHAWHLGRRSSVHRGITA